MDNKEYLEITNKIFENRKFNKLKQETHHYNSNRFNHSLEVSYKTYKICKKYGLDYESATKAALLHDFFFDDNFKNKKYSLLNHGKIAVENASRITKLTKKEENIIKSHMFPIGGELPKSKESIIVNLIDDYVSLKDKFGGDFKNLRSAGSFMFILLVNIFMK